MGEWVNGKKEGNGSYKFPNGDLYEGGWKNDQIMGEGKFIYKDG